jgi:hypothetical protein
MIDIFAQQNELAFVKRANGTSMSKQMEHD